jgi:hypothetical protein
MVASVQEVPIAWQLPQLLLVMGATVWALAPLVGRPALGVVAFTAL